MEKGPRAGTGGSRRTRRNAELTEETTARKPQEPELHSPGECDEDSRLSKDRQHKSFLVTGEISKKKGDKKALYHINVFHKLKHFLQTVSTIMLY